MLTEKEIEELQKGIVDIYDDIENELMGNIAKRLQIDDKLGGTEEWHAKKLKEVKALERENIKYIASKAGKTEKEVEKLFKDAALISVEDDEVEYIKGVDAGKLKKTPPPIKESKGIQIIVKKAVKDGNKYLNLTNTACIQNASKEFLAVVNTAFIQVDQGIYSYQTAVRRASMKLADKGIIAQTYKLKDGRILQYPIDSAIRREVLTSSLQTARDAQDERAKEYGADLYEVSSHVGARPKCAVDQGQIYSRSGKSKKFKSQSQTSEGQPDGLFGINCSHQRYPFIDGVSKQRFFPQGKGKNEKIYKESQQQRYLENEVKKEKRRLIVSDKQGDTEQFERSSFKLKQKEANLNKFMEDTGRTQTTRTQVTGFDRSLSQKAVQANKRADKN